MLQKVLSKDERLPTSGRAQQVPERSLCSPEMLLLTAALMVVLCPRAPSRMPDLPGNHLSSHIGPSRPLSSDLQSCGCPCRPALTALPFCPLSQEVCRRGGQPCSCLHHCILPISLASLGKMQICPPLVYFPEGCSMILSYTPTYFRPLRFFHLSAN